MTFTDQELERLAKGLSEAQHEIVDRLAYSKLPAWALRDDHLGVKAARDIRKMPSGIVEKVDLTRFGSRCWWYALSDKGLALRDYLERMK